METFSSLEIIKALAQYGVLGLGWFAWILTMFYLQAERKRYQALVIYIIQYFTKVNMPDQQPPHQTDPTEILGQLFNKKTNYDSLLKFFGDKK